MRKKSFSDFLYLFRKHSLRLVFVSLIILILAAAADYLYNGSDAGLFSLICYLAAAFCYSMSIIFSNENRYPFFDEYIIQDAFRGSDAASRKFRRALKLLRAGEYHAVSLDILREVSEYQLKEREKAVLFYYTGVIYREMGYPTNAASYFERSADIMVLHPAVLLNAERCYSEAGNAEKADELIEKMYALEYDKKYYDFLETDRGLAYLRNNMADKAFEIYSAELENNSDPTGALCGLSVCCLLRDDIEKSREYFRSASLRPDISDQRGFADYYADIARSCGHYDDIKDILPKKENEENDKETLSDREQ